MSEFNFLLIFFFKKTRCVNQIEDVCKEVEKTIKQTIQNTLNSLEKDTELLINKIDAKLKKDKYAFFFYFSFELGKKN